MLVRKTFVIGCAVAAGVAIDLYVPRRVAILLILGACVLAVVSGMAVARKRRSGRLSAAELQALTDMRRRWASTLARFRRLLAIWFVTVVVCVWVVALSMLVPHAVYVAMGLFVFGTVPLVILTRSVTRRLLDRVLAALGGPAR